MIIFSAALLITVLWQGGFSDMSWLICGIVGAGALIKAERRLPPAPLLLLFSGIGAAYIISALISGNYIGGLIGAAKPLIVLIWLLAAYSIPIDIDRAIFISGMTAASLGILAYCNLPYINGAVTAGRLHGSFQYANAFALFLGVCAFITRLCEKRARFAFVIETGLFLTLSIGGIAVFAGGWALACLKDINIRRCFLSQLPQMLSSLLSAGLVFLVSRLVSPNAAILPVVILFAVQKPLERLPRFVYNKWLSLIAAIAAGAALLGLISVVGTRPLGTYAERLIQISDAGRTMISNPLGIGAGMWGLEVLGRQSAFYNAKVLHSGYAEVGAEAGIIGLVCCLLLILYWYANQPFSKYKAAACMILFHGLFDFSLSFFAIALLLCLLCREETDRIATRDLAKHSMLAMVALCLCLVVPSSIKNRALWSGNRNNYGEAAQTLNRKLMNYDTEALVLRMYYSYMADLPELFDKTFDTLKKPNAEAYYMAAKMAERRGDMKKAAILASLCVDNSPYDATGYAIIGEVTKNLTKGEAEFYLGEAESVRDDALRRQHPLARFLP